MPRTRLAVAVFFYTSFALAQPLKVDPDASTQASMHGSTDASTGVSTGASTAEAGVSADAGGVPAPVWPRAPEPATKATASSSSGPRPDPGPGLRERGGRTRRANPATGVLFALVIVAALVWYVVKRIRRH